MKLKVKLIKENQDGSGACEVEYDSEGLALLVQYGMVAIMQEAHERIKRMQSFDAHNTWPFENIKKSPKIKANKNGSKR